MIFEAQLKQFGGDIEGEVILNVNGRDLTCFSYSSLPHDAKQGAYYRVEFTPQVFHEYQVDLREDEVPPSVQQIGKGFSYVMTGRLTGNRLDAGCVVFEDDVLLSDYGYLEGKIVSWKVDRLDAEFLREPVQNSGRSPIE